MKHGIKLSITAVESASREAPLVLRGPFAQSIYRAAQMGYDGVELHIKDPRTIDKEEIDRALLKTGLCVTSIGTGPSYSQEGIYLTHDDPALRQQAVVRMLDHVELGAHWGAVVILGLMKGQIKDTTAGPEIYHQRLSDSLSPILRRAEDLGVCIAVEVIDRFESDWLNTIEEGLDWLSQIGSPALGLHLDTFHMNIEEPNCAASILKAGAAVKHLHVADSDRWYPGHAHYDFASDFAALRQIGYEGAAALESFLYPDEETCARKNVEFLRPLLTP